MTDPSEAARALADELLVVRCQLGERAAFDALAARWSVPLWRYARNLTGDDAAADDATQDIWVKVLRSIPTLRDTAKLRPWLFGIAHRVMMDRLRERYTRPPVTAELDDLPAIDDDDAIEHELALATMLGALADLPLVEKEVLTLFYLRELSLDGVAQALGIPSGTVKSRLHRARRMLRQQIDSKGVLS